MIKLKGEKNSHAQQTMEKAMGMRPKGQQEGPTPVAKALGLPSAVRPSSHEAKDWSSHSNRINMGAPVSIRAKTEAKPLEGDREYYMDQPTTDKGLSAPSDAAESDDDLFEDEGLEAFRLKRLAELKRQAQAQNKWASLGHGAYSEVTQDDFLPSVTQSKYCVCHFFHASFERCRIVDKHLEILSKSALSLNEILYIDIFGVQIAPPYSLRQDQRRKVAFLRRKVADQSPANDCSVQRRYRNRSHHRIRRAWRN